MTGNYGRFFKLLQYIYVHQKQELKQHTVLLEQNKTKFIANSLLNLTIINLKSYLTNLKEFQIQNLNRLQ